MSAEKALDARMAIEALRAGVPNRSAIRLLASADSPLAQEFQNRLRACRQGLREDRAVDGIIIAGAFGAGKSHQLGYLGELARQENWIVSLLPISKETPLFDPAKVFAAAVRTAIVPDANDDVMTAAMQRLGERRNDDVRLELWTDEEVRNGRLARLFAALLRLIQKGNVQPDDLARIARFFGGAKLNLGEVKRWLKEAGVAKLFQLSPVRARDLTRQRLRFAPRLLTAAGFSGWCILLDEVELIGRYSLLQRGKSYSELAWWLGMDDKTGIPGVFTIAAITEDFSAAMFDRMGDDETVAPLLEQRGLAHEGALARLAIGRLKREDYRLNAPDESHLRQALAKIRILYEDAYGWQPPSTELAPPQASKFMRQHVKSWITAWDIQRLYGESARIRIEKFEPDYTESSGLEQSPGADEGAE
ncbi:MAG: BREX system ATP-binding domain-containing protein [Acetobacteraceae bacterium]